MNSNAWLSQHKPGQVKADAKSILYHLSLDSSIIRPGVVWQDEKYDIVAVSKHGMCCARQKLRIGPHRLKACDLVSRSIICTTIRPHAMQGSMRALICSFQIVVWSPSATMADLLFVSAGAYMLVSGQS